MLIYLLLLNIKNWQKCNFCKYVRILPCNNIELYSLLYHLLSAPVFGDMLHYASSIPLVPIGTQGIHKAPPSHSVSCDPLTSFQFFPPSRPSSSIVRLHDCFGHPIFLALSGFQSSACLSIDLSVFLSVWPIQFHKCMAYPIPFSPSYLICDGILFCSVP